MLSRALSSATVMLLIGWFAAAPAPALAQATNLEAGKSPSQIFEGTCTACHKSPRGLLRTVPAGSLPGFLREHYTTSSNMAGLLSAYLIANGAGDRRNRADQAKPTPEPAKPDAQPQQAAKPDADGLSPQAEPGRKGRNARRLARPGEAPDAAKPVEGQAPAQAAGERGPDGRLLSIRQRLGKRGRPPVESPTQTDAAKPDAAKTDAAKTDAPKNDIAKPDAAKIDAAKDDPSAKAEPSATDEPAKEAKPAGEAAKDSGGKPEGNKPAAEAKSEPARAETPKATGGGEPPAQRADPAAAVTPAPAAPPAPSTAVSGATPERPPAPAPTPVAPAVAASAPPSPPAPAGPPVPPISQ